MSLVFFIVSGYVLAIAAPWLQRVLGWKAGLIISGLPLVLTVYFATLIPAILRGEVIYIFIPWVPGLGIAFSFFVDGLSLLFALLISGIGTLVFFYSSNYLKGHPYQGRFYMYMLIFMASMLGLVLSGNLLSLFVFWELTSVSSFLLIGFQHYTEKSRYSALQALLVTSTGGLALMAGMVMIGMVTQSLELPQILTQKDVIQNSPLYLPILGLILAGAFTKSAQFPFHFWLPNAMEAPTPVSAYLHSATMVKAGIYVLARFSPVLAGSDAWLNTVTIVGTVTMVVGAFLALNHWDKKRILAYSTISGLGMLTLLLGLGTEQAIQAMIVFLVAHAFYKGALFLVAGAVEHETGSRNVNILRGLGKAMPVTSIAAIISGLSLAGIPPLLGFIAKETILETTGHSANAAVITAFFIISSAALTAIAYIVAIRLFFGKESKTPRQPHEPSVILWFGPMVLAFLSLIIGLAPSSISSILSVAASSIAGHPISFDLALWHGFTFEVALSVVTVASGIAIYFAHGHLKRAWEEIRMIVFKFSPEQLYSRSIGILFWTARMQTRVLQSGYLRNYLSIVFMAMVAIVGFTIWRLVGDQSLNLSGTPTFTEYAIAIAMLAAALMTARLSFLLSAIVSTGIVGYGVALIYILFGAPDLAMTQFLVETLTVVLLVLGFYHLPKQTRQLVHTLKIRNILVAVSSGALITILMVLVINSHAPSLISTYFAENSYILADGRNVVNVILVDFRALDTLGETVVLAVAGMGVYILLKKKPGKDKN